MKLQILSTIVAMSMAGASATAITCDGVQTIYQSAACCSEPDAPTCAQKLEVDSSDTYLVLDDATGMLTTKDALTNALSLYDAQISILQRRGPIIQSNADAIATLEEEATNAVTEEKLATNAVTAEKLATNAVTEEKLATNAVTADKLADDAVTEAKLADDAVTTDKLEDGAVTGVKLDATLTAAISDNTDAIADIMNGSTSALDSLSELVNEFKNLDSNLSQSFTDLLGTHTSRLVRLNDTLTGNINANAIAIIDGSRLAANTVTTAKLDNGAVTEEKLANYTVTTAKLDNGAVTAVKLATNAVTTAKLDDNAVTIAKLAGEWVESTSYGDIRRIQHGMLTTFNDDVQFNKPSSHYGLTTEGYVIDGVLQQEGLTVKNGLTVDTGEISGNLAVGGNVYWDSNDGSDQYKIGSGQGSVSRGIEFFKDTSDPARHFADINGFNLIRTEGEMRHDGDLSVYGTIKLTHGGSKAGGPNAYTATNGFEITSGHHLSTNPDNGVSIGAGFRHFTSGGKVYLDLYGVDMFRLDKVTQLTMAENYLVESDIRIKKNIETIPDNLAIETFRGLDAKYYNYISENRTTIKQIGFIAQEVREAIPEAVSVMPGTLPDGTEVDDFHYIDKAKIFAVAYSALQEVDKTQQALLATVAALEARLALLE